MLVHFPKWAAMRVGSKVLSNKVYACPVCDYLGFDEDPLAHTYDICPRCGVEFGYDDAGTAHRVLRSRWIQAGKPYWRALSEGEKERYMEILHPPLEQDLLSDALAALAAVLLMRALPASQLGPILACLRDNGAGALAEVILGRLTEDPLPFDDTPPYDRMLQ